MYGQYVEVYFSVFAFGTGHDQVLPYLLSGKEDTHGSPSWEDKVCGHFYLPDPLEMKFIDSGGSRTRTRVGARIVGRLAKRNASISWRGASRKFLAENNCQITGNGFFEPA